MPEQLFVVPVELWQVILVFISLHALVLGGVLIGLLVATLRQGYWKKEKKE